MRETEQLAVQSKVVYLDPSGCGSSIGYRLYIERNEYTKGEVHHHLYGYVDLADCAHKIEWVFDVGGLEKIDEAIRLLQDFRKAFVNTVKLHQKLEAK